MMDASASNYHDAEFLIFNTGRWWNPNKVKNGYGSDNLTSSCGFIFLVPLCVTLKTILT